MIKGLRKIFTTIILGLIMLPAYGQTNYYKLAVGAGGGINNSYTDVNKGKLGYSTYTAFDFYVTPNIITGLETQFGTVKGGVDDPYLRAFTNSYFVVTANARAQLGEFIDFDYLYRNNNFLNALKGVYLGAGFGVINNNLTSVVREKPDGSHYIFPGEDKSMNLILPINLGINVYFPNHWGNDRYVVNANFQTNYVFGEGLDGYNDPPAIFKNLSPDMYINFTIGFKYLFGSVGIKKRIL